VKPKLKRKVCRVGSVVGGFFAFVFFPALWFLIWLLDDMSAWNTARFLAKSFAAMITGGPEPSFWDYAEEEPK